MQNDKMATKTVKSHNWGCLEDSEKIIKNFFWGEDKKANALKDPKKPKMPRATKG